MLGIGRMNKLLSILLVTLLASCTNEIDKNNAKKDVVVDPQPIVINSAQSQAPVFIAQPLIYPHYLLMDCALQALINPTTCLNLMQ
jgi:hypothetical protein